MGGGGGDVGYEGGRGVVGVGLQDAKNSKCLVGILRSGRNSLSPHLNQEIERP